MMNNFELASPVGILFSFAGDRRHRGNFALVTCTLKFTASLMSDFSSQNPLVICSLEFTASFMSDFSSQDLDVKPMNKITKNVTGIPNCCVLESLLIQNMWTYTTECLWNNGVGQVGHGFYRM